MRRGLRKGRRFFAYVLTVTMLVTMVSQSALPVLAAEPGVESQSEVVESDTVETEPEGDLQDDIAEEERPGQDETSGEDTDDQNADTEQDPDTDQEDSDAEQNPDEDQNADEAEESDMEQVETVSGSDLNTDVMNEEDQAALFSDSTEQGWVGDIYWSILNGNLYVQGSGNYFENAFNTNPPWTPYAKQIKTAEIRLTGMTSTAHMFSGCENLTSITFKSFDTSEVTNMSGMFQGCKNLKSIELGKFRTDKVESMSSMFEGCSSLTELDFSRLDTSSVANAASMFRECRALKRVDFSQYRAKNLKNIQYIFFNCENLQSVDLSGFSTENVTNLMDMFNGCRSLQTINWGNNFKTGAVTNIQGMFTGCSSLTELDLSGFDLSKVTDEKNIRYFLSGCYGLEVIQTPDKACSLSIALPSGDWFGENGAKYTELPTFLSRATLTKMTVDDSDIASGTAQKIQWRIDADGKLTVKGSGDFSSSTEYDRAPWYAYADKIKTAVVDVKGMTDASHMFSDCSNMTSLDLSKFDTSSVTDMGDMFGGCSALTSLDLSRFSTGNVTNMSDMFQGCRSLKTLDLSRFDTSKVTNMEIMFMDCSSLTSLDLSSFDTRNVTSMCFNEGGMFSYCESLVTLDLSSFDTRNVDQFRWMFSNCKKLKNLYIDRFDLRSASDIGGMFSGCESLEQFDFGVFTHYDDIYDMSYFFADCKKLKKVNWKGFDTGSVGWTSGMFENCSSLTSLDLRGFDTSGAYEMGSMFRGCSNLTKLDVSGFDTGNAMNMKRMFQDCRKLTQLDMSHFETDNVVDMGWMFQNCSSLTTLDLSGFDAAALQETDSYFYYQGMKEMLDGCTKLATLYTPYNIPSNLQNPAALPGGTWYMTDGTGVTQIPSLDHSVKLTKKQPAATASAAKTSITVKKTKTAYSCGETVNTNDLTVTYYGGDGTVKKVTDYTTNVNELDISVPGKKMLVVTYQDLTAQKDLTAQVELTFTRKITDATVTLTVPEAVYAGIPRTPVPTVRMTIGGKLTTLAYGRDFKTSYTNNVNAGQDTAKVTITGINDYSGTANAAFTIKPAAVTIRPLDMTFAVGDLLPGDGDFEYRVTGLYQGDALINEPSFTCNVTDMGKAGVYTISYVAGSADAGTNYQITGTTAALTVAQERISYTVTFDYAGHIVAEGGSTTYVLTDIIAGSLIKGREPKPADKGYLFKGWYKDRDYKKAWDFDTDTVQENLTLYACWVLDASQQEKGADLCVKEIEDQAYTGNQIKPTVVVYAGADSEPLKAGKDYTIKYVNNIEADKVNETGGVSASESESGTGFTKELPYVVITGKGNYIGTVCRNFHIAPASVADDGENLAQGFTLKYTEQMTVNVKKAQKPFTSLKYKKAMKTGTDYDVKLTAVAAYDETGDVVEGDHMAIGETGGSTVLPEIPAGWRGTFLLTVTGKGNYSGTFTKNVYVSDKNKLIKNASITLGKNLKNVEYTGEDIALKPAWYDTARKKYYEVDNEGNINRRVTLAAADVFTVKFGKEYLLYGKDFSVSYTNNRDVGTAVLTINGEGDYMGTKSVTFKIKGTAFNTKNVSVDAETLQTVMPYTGNALTQNGVALAKGADGGGEELVYGRDYSIGYKNNRKKGTATMTFTASAASGYSGNFKKTFKIAAADLQTAVKASVSEEEVPYAREGAKLTGQILLTNNTTGDALKEGVDYTVSYANNKTVTESGGNLPVMTIKGKGNYAGSLQITYRIKEAQWSLDLNGNLKADATPIAFDERKADTYVYVPKIKVTDGKAVLKAGKDYETEAHNCTQDEIREYLKAMADLRAGTSSVTQETLESMRPYVILTAKEGSGYTAGSSFRVDVNIYQNKLAQNNLYIVVSEDAAQTTYTGSQVTPDVVVYYGDTAAVKAAKRDKITEESALTDPAGEYGLTKLQYRSDGTGDYTLTYGNNVAAGKNKGSVTVVGTGLYGVSVTVKFTILQKDVYKI